MKTGRHIICLTAAALAVGLTACADDLVGRTSQELDSARDHDYEEWPTVTSDQVDDLPPCSEIDIPSGKEMVYVVAGAGGLLALSVDGELICVDDHDGMENVGVPDQLIPDNHRTEPPDDGTLIPGDGTPLPAGPTGPSGVTDGTPLPA